MSRFDRYMAVPFKHGGRDFAGADCFGLYALVLAHEAGITIDDIAVEFADGPRKVPAAVAAALARGGWTMIDKLGQFDAAVMTAYCGQGLATRRVNDMHVGCMLDDRRMLHTEEHSGPRIMAIDDPEIIPRLCFFARPAALLERAA